MFADPRAAALRSAEVRGVIGNSAWGRRMLQFKSKYKHPKKPKLCEYCQQEIHSKTDTNALLIRERLRHYEKKQTPQPVDISVQYGT